MARKMKDSGIEWIGEIPVEWGKNKTTRIFGIIGSGTTPKFEEVNHSDNSIHWIQSGDINGAYLTKCKIDITEEMLRQYSALTHYSAPFIIIAMYGASIGNISLSQIDGCVNQACCVLSRSNQDISYMFFALKMSKEYLIWKAVGGGQPNINQEIIKKLWIPIPSMKEQNRIVQFLYSQCECIDGIIKKTIISIEEYKKLKQAVITQAVTKGIRPDRSMKDSDVEWIGDIPKEWSIYSLGALTESLRNGYVGPTKDLFYEEGVKYIQSLHIKEGKIDFSRHEYFVSESWADSHPKIKKNDILIVQTGDIGSVGLVTDEYDGCNCHALIIATPRVNIILPQYLTYYFRSTVGRELLLYYKTGALLPHLNSGKIKFANVCVPDINEQKEIVRYLDFKTAKIDQIISGKMNLLRELDSYKKSLIYEYVTGKKEVPA